MSTESLFKRRYGVSLNIFRFLCTQLADADPYFRQSADATGLLGHRTEIKVAAALRQLRYGVAADALDDSLQISETVANDALKLFCYYVVKLFRQEWIRPPRRAELEKSLSENEDRGFPGTLGSGDCMHLGVEKLSGRLARAVSGEGRSANTCVGGCMVCQSL